jgi:hypothetical protein
MKPRHSDFMRDVVILSGLCSVAVSAVWTAHMDVDACRCSLLLIAEPA